MIGIVVDGDLRDTTFVLERSNGVLLDLTAKARCPNGDGHCRPDTQHLPPKRSAVVIDFEVQTDWCREHDGSPPSTHVQQSNPSLFKDARSQLIGEHAEIKYDEKDLVRKHVNCDVAWDNETVSCRDSALSNKTYLDLVRLIELKCGGLCSDRPSMIFRKNGRAVGVEK